VLVTLVVGQVGFLARKGKEKRRYCAQEIRKIEDCICRGTSNSARILWLRWVIC